MQFRRQVPSLLESPSKSPAPQQEYKIATDKYAKNRVQQIHHPY